MDREEATRALEVLQRVVKETRDDTALQNWGVIWMIQSVLLGGGFIGTHVMLGQGIASPPPFAGMWAAIILGGLLVRLGLKRSRAGVRSFVETQLWAIWTTFIAAVSLVAVLNHLMGLRTFFLGPVIGILAGVAFAMMGSIMGRSWFVASGVFVLAAFAMAAFPDVQFLVFGVIWGVAQFSAGFLLDRSRRRASPKARLV